MSNSPSKIEHFLLLGPRNLPSELKYDIISNNSFEVGLIDSYPKIDSLPEYLDHINLWCFPDGYQVYDSYKNVINNGDVIKSRNSKPSSTIREEMGNFSIINHFILTDKDYNKRYCSALMFYEKYDLNDNYPGFSQTKLAIDKNIVFCSKVLCIISSISILDTHHQVLTFIFEKLIKPKHFQFMPIKPQTTLLPNSLFDSFKEYQSLHGKERGDVLFNEKFNEIERKSPDLKIVESDYLEFYLSFFYFCLPTNSPPEDYLVSIEGISEKSAILKYNISKDQNLYEQHFRSLFTKMQLPNILKLIKFCLLEKSIIIFSNNPNETIAITETLLSLINPLKWTCIYAPVLPISMVQILQAVIPYLVGMHSKHKDFVLSSMDLSDKVIVDLDEDYISCSEDSVFLPKGVVERITRKLSKIIKKLQNQNIAEKELLEATFNIKAAFSDLMLGLINNYIPFFLFSRDFNDKTVISSEIFDQNSYSKIFPIEDLTFLEDFTSKTMMFNKFLEDSYKLLYFLDYLKKDIIPTGLEDTNNFISGLKKILKTLNKGQNKFEGFIELESLQHLQRLIDLDKDLRLQMALENHCKPKTLKTLQYFTKYYQTLGEELSQKNDGFLLIKGFNAKRMLILNNNIKSINNINVFREKAPMEDDLIEFTSINLPTNPMIFLGKSPEILPGQENEPNKGLIEAILLKEMELCLQDQKKPRRKTIFSNEENLKPKAIDMTNIDEILNKKVLPPALVLKKAQSEQPIYNKPITNINKNIQSNIEPFDSKSQIPKSFQNFSNKNRSQKPENDEEITRKVPILNVNSFEKDPNAENQDFSILSYLISDLMKEDENKLSYFPIKPKGKEAKEYGPLQLKRQLTAGEKPQRNTFMYERNSKKDNSFIGMLEVNKSQEFPLKTREIFKGQETKIVKETIKINNEVIKSQEITKYQENFVKENVNFGYLENILQNNNKTPKKNNGIFAFDEKRIEEKKEKHQIFLENKEKIGFVAKGFGRKVEKMVFEKKPLKEMTNFTLNASLEASSYDYNSRLLRKK